MNYNFDDYDEFGNPIKPEPSPYERPAPEERSRGTERPVRRTQDGERPVRRTQDGDRPRSSRSSSGYSGRYERGSSRSSGSRSRSGSRYRRSRRVKASPLFSMLFFPCAILYHELLLRIFDKDLPFFSMALLRLPLLSLAAGLFIFLILDLIPNKSVSRWAGGILSFIFIVILCVERGMRKLFSIYYGIISAGKVAGDAVGDFTDNLISAIIGLIPFILLALVPLVIFILMRRVIFHDRGQRWPARGLIAVLLIIAQLLGVALSKTGEAKAAYTYNFDANTGIPEFGLLTSIRLELQYAIFGMPEMDLDFTEDPTGDEPAGPSDPGDADDPDNPDAPDDPDDPGSPDAPDNPDDPENPGEPQTPAVPVEYGYNTLDIDFASLIDNSSGTIQNMHEYFGSLGSTKQSEYTGMFEGKNLILITAESFSPYVIDKDLTPTLYRLTHEAFVFNHFYQPDWTQSTVGGEFSVVTGLIPNWVNGDVAARESIGNYFPTTLGNMFKALGYVTPAWHNGSYTYYSRNKYLETFGYDFKGEEGGGLDLTIDSWPRSDKEMFEVTADEYINAYVQTGQKFHAYYMTISGHGNWSFAKNHRAADYKDLVQQKYPDLSEPCQSYIASNIDLDRGLEVLVKKLEDAGIADDTLIVMCTDHYPYFLGNGNNNPGDSTDYYNELTNAIIGETDSEAVTSRYRSTLLMWSGCIKEPIIVDTPCSSIDIVPTVANLFGLKYDSRLYSGRDIFATNWEADKYSSTVPVVIFADSVAMKGNSWITPAGTYESSTKTFTPAPGVTLEDQNAYVASVKRLVAGKIQNAKLIISQDYYAKIFD